MEYGIYPPPTSASDALKQITDYLLGKDWCVTDPISQEQVNTIIVEEIKKIY